MWGAVRIAALVKPGGRRQWLRDSWLVIPLVVPALLIVGPPAILVMIALGIFFLLEFVVYLPLRVAHAVQESRDRPAKEVNAPTLDWKTT